MIVYNFQFKKSQIPGTQELMEKLNMKSQFFFVNDTVNLFPSLEYTSDSIPLGNSINFCISASWANKESINNFY